MSEKKDLYKEAGVDVDKGDALVDWLSDSGKIGTQGGEVVSGIGGFAALFRPNFQGMKDPLLVTGTDGVGTKVLLAIEENQLEGLGFDLVAMCVNDLYTVGGRPLFFLDYYATGVLDEAQFKAVLSGIRKALKQCDTALLGGETAELPGLYEKGHFDLAGFVVGVVDGAKRLQPNMVKEGDVLVALESSGFHSNGYSLLRKWLKDKPDPLHKTMALTPTRIYHELPSIHLAMAEGSIHALANITGGGISGNLPRVLPADTTAVIDPTLLPTPDWMKAIFAKHDASFEQIESVFNMGAGMIAAVARSEADTFISECGKRALKAVRIGHIEQGHGEAQVRFI
ncbi:MAG: phosphoribosylformylglycinamidine cyclo-ligase [Bdellovibrionota bacterium]